MNQLNVFESDIREDHGSLTIHACALLADGADKDDVGGLRDFREGKFQLLGRGRVKAEDQNERQEQQASQGMRNLEQPSHGL